MHRQTPTSTSPSHHVYRGLLGLVLCALVCTWGMGALHAQMTQAQEKTALRCDAILKAKQPPIPLHTLEARYKALAATMNPTFYEDKKPVFHKTMPTPDSVGVWFLAESHAHMKKVVVCVKEEEAAPGCLDSVGIERLYMPTTRTGKVTITGLKSAQTYHMSLALNDDPPSTFELTTAPTSTPDTFSFMAFSCNEPYTTTREGILARDALTWRTFLARATGELGQDRDGILPAQPSFYIGLGDQIYVDPDPGRKKEGISFFHGKRSNQWLVHPHQLSDLLNVVYRYVFKIPTTSQAFADLPGVMTWDDHEIRDGYGSQGDELVDTCQKMLYTAARMAFVGYQALRNPSYGPTGQSPLHKASDVNDILDKNIPLTTQFQWGDRASFFVIDSRTPRDTISDIAGFSQIQAIKDWFARVDDDQPHLFVLGSAGPVFYDIDRIIPAQGGFKDDLKDQWNHKTHKEEYRELLETIQSHFKAHPAHRLLVLSGDVHMSSLIYLKLDGHVFGHEIITSGIAHGVDKGLSTLTARKVVNYPDLFKDVPGIEIEVYPRGAIYSSPAFAEISVSQQGQKGMTLHVKFWTSAGARTALRSGKARLANDMFSFSDQATYHVSKPYCFNTPSPPSTSCQKDESRGWIHELSYNKVPAPASQKGNKVKVNLHYETNFCVVNDTKAVDTLAKDWFKPLGHNTSLACTL